LRRGRGAAAAGAGDARAGIQVKLDDEKLRRLEMARALHALQQGSDMAAVFARYEADLERLRRSNEELRTQCGALARAAAEAAPCTGGSPSTPCGRTALADLQEQPRSNGGACAGGKLPSKLDGAAHAACGALLGTRTRAPRHPV
jgi:hypothetical protein